MSKLNRFLLSGLVLVGAACGDDVTVVPPPPPPEPGIRSVTVGPDGAEVAIGASLPMTVAITTDPGATGTATVAWSSSDPAKATVNATSGVVTGVTLGSVGIRATATLGTSTGSGLATVHVVGTTGCVVSGVTVSPPSASLPIGTSLQLAAVVNGTNCTEADFGVSYTSGNTGIATVSATGVVTAVGGGTTTVVIKSDKDPTKQTAMSVQVTVADPATISIQSITQGGLGVPINLQNVNGQIEITLNVDAGGKALDRVDALIGGIPVASQSFASTSAAADAGAAASAPVTVVLNVNTMQLQLGLDRDAEFLFAPVVFNGNKAITANLYVEGESAPISSNAVPVLMNNRDQAIAPGYLTTGDLGAIGVGLTDEEDADDLEPFVDGLGRTWHKGDFFARINYVAFSGIRPATSLTLLAPFSPLCGIGAQTSTPSGGPTAGIVFHNSWSCTGPNQFEGQRNVSGPGATAWDPGTVGIDGSALAGPLNYSAVTSTFCISNVNPCPELAQRWNLITPSNTPLSGPYWVDNQAPGAFIAGAGSAGPVTGKVAFNDAFDQFWISNESDPTAPSYYAWPIPSSMWDAVTNPSGDWFTTDGGSGVNFDGTYVAQWNLADGLCDGPQLNGGFDLPVSNTSNEDIDAHFVCLVSTDNVGNVGTSGRSNGLGVDGDNPLSRIAGSTLAGPVPPGISLADPASGVSATPDASIFGNPGLLSAYTQFDPTVYLGIEGQDGTSGFNQFAVTGYPAAQTMTVLSPSGFNPAALTGCGFTNPLPVILTDNWVRVTLGAASVLDCTLGIPGYYWLSMKVIDRSGRESAPITRNWAIDQYAAPVLASVGPAAIFYTAGQPANFFLFGSDDLEFRAADLTLNYPGMTGTDGLVSVTKPQSAIGGATLWDLALTNILAGAPAIDPYLFGRVDRTCAGAGTPYASCTGAVNTPIDLAFSGNDGVPVGVNGVEFNNGLDLTNDGKNPNGVQAVAYDVALQPSAPVVAGLLTAQTNDVAEQWSGTLTGQAQLLAWRLVQPLGSVAQAEWATTSSLVNPYLDGAYLARAVGGSLVICRAFPGPTRIDNGGFRAFTYTVGWPDVSDAAEPCRDAVGGDWYVVGVKNGAALVSAGVTP